MRRLVKPLVVRYLAFFARIALRRARPLVIAVAGSSGKTSTAAAVAAALAPTKSVRTGGGMNTETGVSLGILGIPMREYGAFSWLKACLLAPFKATSQQPYDAYVAEYGIDHPGDMRELLRVRVPDIAVVTSVGLEHSGYFPDGTLDETLDAIADEEMSLVRALPTSATAVVPTGDARIADRLKGVRATVRTVGEGEAACRVANYAVSANGTDLEIAYQGATVPARFAQPVTRASVTSVALAAVAASAAGIPFRDALATIASSWEVPAGRGRVLEGKEGRLLIDSSYNATPDAVADALRLLKDVSASRRRVAILGDMRELGLHAPEAHAGLADDVAGSADLVLLVGPTMQEHLLPLLAGRVSQAESFGTVTELFAKMDDLLQPQDVVLVKGSQNTLFLERVVERLLARPEDAARLPRRGPRWDRIRAMTP